MFSINTDARFIIFNSQFEPISSMNLKKAKINKYVLKMLAEAKETKTVENYFFI